MVYGLGLGAVLELCLIVYCLLDCITTPAARCRNLPKPVWLILCFIPPFVGPISWLLFGRPRGADAPPARGSSAIPPEYDRPGRAAAQNPDDDAAFLAQLRQRAEEQRRRAAEQAEQVRRQEEPPPA